MIYRITETGAEYRKMARGEEREREASWQRSDTDGFLSQWASGLTAQIYEACAEIADNQGKWKFKVLCDLTGAKVKARPIQGKYGMVWAIMGKYDETIGFASYHPKKKETLEKKGFQEIEMELPAVVMTSSARGSYNVSIVKWAEEWL